MNVDPYLKDISGLDTHLRDARHANQLYTQHNFALGPKVKFLYHIVFELYDEVGNASNNNTQKFKKEIGVLAQTADLPQYRISVENKQQYNRKKNIQTRLDYQDVTLTFFDDNLGLTRGLLQDYYKYYYVDGNHKDGTGTTLAYDTRDKYKEAVPSYGLNNKKTNPFFKFVRIYQLARREWFAYTLINPLISSFDHGDVDATTGAEPNKNTITLAYESVLYSNGKVGELNEPVGFSDPETAYDNVPSPQGKEDLGDSRFEYDMLSQVPELVHPSRMRRNPPNTRQSNNRSRRDSIFGLGGRNSILGAGILDGFNNGQPGGLRGTNIPQTGNAIDTVATLVAGNDRVFDGDFIAASLNSNQAAKSSFISRAMNSNAISGESLSTFNSASASKKAAIETELINRASNGDRKLAGQASDAIQANKGSILT